MPMFTVSNSQFVRPGNLVHGLPSFSPLDHLVKVVHLFSGVYVCASILMHNVFFRNVDGRLP
jgi:hypothetical protein